MSFAFEWTAVNKAAAKEKIATEHAPAVVKEFLLTAVDGIRDIPPDASGADPVYVKATGHLADGQSYEVSTATIEVRRITLVRAPTPVVA